jgi:tRNA threonylcarbamoyladenosine biosynthesis protein TsaB
VNELILAVDTTHEFGSLALLRGEELLEEVLLHNPEGFGRILFGRIADLLARYGCRVTEVDCFAAASGPGSFTGVRVGLACIKGLAEATAKPAVAVSNLAAMATFGSAPLRAVVLDARRGEVYGAVYNAAGDVLLPETVMPFPAWLETLPHGEPDEIEFIALDPAVFPFPDAPVTVAPRALAAAIARIARTAKRLPPEAIDANYVRRSDAELFWKEY